MNIWREKIHLQLAVFLINLSECRVEYWLGGQVAQLRQRAWICCHPEVRSSVVLSLESIEASKCSSRWLYTPGKPAGYMPTPTVQLVEDKQKKWGVSLKRITKLKFKNGSHIRNSTVQYQCQVLRRRFSAGEGELGDWTWCLCLTHLWTQSWEWDQLG